MRIESWRRSLMMWDFSRWTLSFSAWLMILVLSNDILLVDFSSQNIFSLQECSFRCKWLGIITIVNAKRIWLPNLLQCLKQSFPICSYLCLNLLVSFNRNLSFHRKLLWDWKVLILRNFFKLDSSRYRHSLLWNEI